MKPIHIFRTGTHQAMSGDEIRFTEADLARVADGYDPALSEAPIVVGHPAHDAPAYGWVQAVELKGGELYCSPGQVEPAFAEMVSQGRFKKVSAAFYTPQAPANPKPGQYYLRHVGFLGAQPPAVKGLNPVAFADAGVGEGTHVVTVEMVNESTSMLAAALEAIAKALSVLAPVKPEPEAETETTEPAADGGDGNATSPAATETAAAAVPAEPVQYSEADLVRARALLEAECKRFELERNAAEHRAFLAARVAEGRVLPVEEAGLLAFFESIQPDQTVAFAEGGEMREVSGLAFLKGFIEKLPPRVQFAEVSAEDACDAEPLSPRDIAERAEIYAREQKAQGVAVSTARAVRHVVGA